MKARLWFILILMMLAPKLQGFTGATEAFREDHIQVQLLSRERSLRPGETQTFAVRFVPDQHWHVYWQNPGDSGNPPEVQWIKPSSLVAEPFHWPTPERILVDPFYSFGYQGEVILPFQVKVPSDISGAVDLEVLVKWLVCEESCIPGKRAFAFSMPVNHGPNPEPGEWDKVIDQALTQAPQGTVAAQVKTEAERVTLQFAKNERALGTRIVDFFPDEGTGVKYGLPVIKDWEVILEKNAETPTRALSGLLVLANADGQRSSYLVSSKPIAAPRDWSILLLAFVGGLILNAMPCVLPVLAIKVLSLVRESGADARKVRMGSLAYGAGVVLSFLGLAGVLLLFKAGGQSVGWGFQLQSPIFIGALALLFFLLALNFLDLIQPWNALTRMGNVGANQSGWGGQFLSGVLAVIVASPCTGPFMGVAVGSALTRSTWDALLIFLFIGLGFLSPFIVLAWVPVTRRWLPKPGMWMETFRQAMAFPLLLTLIWLLWVLEKQTGMTGVLWILGAYVGLGFGTWLWHQMRGRAPRSWMLVMAIMVVVSAVALSQQKAPEQTVSRWENFSPETIAEARRQGPVFIDFTAAWCVTCQVNKTLVLHREEVQKAFAERGVRLFQADWTDYNPIITQTLAALGRQGVPVYVLYRDADGPAQLLPEVLTPDLVIKEIGNLPLTPFKE